MESENILPLSLHNPLPRDNHHIHCKSWRRFSALLVTVPNLTAMTTCTSAEEAIMIKYALHIESSLCATCCWKHFCRHSLSNLHDTSPGWQRQDSNSGIWIQDLGWTELTPPLHVSILVMSKLRQPLLGLDSSIQPLALESDKSWHICLYHSLALWLWADLSTSTCLSFLICKTGRLVCEGRKVRNANTINKIPSTLSCAKLLQLCSALCDPMDWDPQRSSVHGILQARILEWVVISSSRGSSQPRDRTWISCVSCDCRRISYPTEPSGKLAFKAVL